MKMAWPMVIVGMALGAYLVWSYQNKAVAAAAKAKAAGTTTTVGR